jgi:hypothetical protein
VLDVKLIEKIAGALLTDESLIEKDWHVVRAIGVIASLDHGQVTPVFSGGTSLAKGWGLIKRFSEDIDFKVIMPASSSRSENRNYRRSFRERVLSALTANGFVLVDPLISGNQSRFFSAAFLYPSHFAIGQGLRPHLRIEMSFQPPALNPINRQIQSFVSEARKNPPEVPCFPCIDPIETAADKLSALCWRVCTRDRKCDHDDPTIVRHLHDLAALEKHITDVSLFVDLVQKTVAADTGRGGLSEPLNPSERFEKMLGYLHKDQMWATEYHDFVTYVSYAKPPVEITFVEAISALTRIVALVSGKT